MKSFSRTFYYSPDDDLEKAFLDFVQSARRKVRICDYSFNLPALVDLLIEQKSAGLDIGLVLDRSQAAGPTERPQLDRLRAAGVPMVIGTSSKHKIIHDKYAVIDDEAVLYGSFNFTVAAQSENNFFVIEANLDLAELFTSSYEAIRSWIVANEPQESGST